MAVVHVALERRFVGSFPALGRDPIGDARRAATARGALPPGRDGDARCLVRDGFSVYRVSAVEAGWLVGSFQAGGSTFIPLERFANEADAHNWLLNHLGFAAASAEAVN